ncbi:MAG: 5-formyltetrahydrofolate cyclo-ligase [Papillibacter sp.]|jgi:5-formyltetrahydrofolate cyclo-ligase|nr:5-formyltetrahydrofolate cyclo-ligase [Papillibacter sp.]
MSTMREIKRAFRKEINKRLNALDEKYLEKSDQSIYDIVSVLEEVKNADTVFMYCSLGREIDTRKLMQLCFDKGQKVALPVCVNDTDLVFKELSSSSELVTGMYDLLEPPLSAPEAKISEKSVMITPSLTYDRQGYRMGKGKGYYDRWLSKHKIYSVGVAREALMVDEVPREPHDVRVDCLVTEKGLIRFNK